MTTAAEGEASVLLLHVAESLAAAGGVDEVCRVIVQECRERLGAAGAGIAIRDEHEPALRVVQLIGYPDETVAAWQLVPLETASPLTKAVREGRPVFIADEKAWSAEFPETPLTFPYRSRAALPLVDGRSGETVGAVLLSWPHERVFDEAERYLLRTVAALCAQALGRALDRDEKERERFASAVDAMLDPVGIYGAIRDDHNAIVDFRIEYVNEATGVLGVESDEADDVVGHTLRELFPYLQDTGRISEYAHVVETREPLSLPTVRVGTAGVDERVFDIQVAPFQDGIIIATRDVTDRYQAEAGLALSEARLNAAQRVGRIGSWEADADGHTVWSEELYRMFGASPIDRPDPDAVMKRTIPLDQRVRLRTLVGDLWSTGVPFATEYPVLTGTGERRWFSARAEVQDGPTGPLVRGVVQDITEQRELERALSTLTADLRDERAAAEVLQRALLPQELPQVAGTRVFAVYEPAGRGTHAGGDWYDAFTLPDGRLAFTIGDVAGHGLSAAATMSELRHAIRAFASLDADPGRVVTRLSTMFAAWSAEPYATCLFAVHDPATSTIEFANAGHLPMVVRRADAASFVPTSPGPPLGAAPYDYGCQLIEAGPGELYLLYTDGLVERRGEGIDVGLERLRTMVDGLAGLPARDVCERLVWTSREGGARADDVCVVAVEVGLPTDGD